jgi:carbon-monoxide dehydrogenase medium subunit
MPVPKPFEYYAPTSVENALNLLSENEESKFVAGGQSLIPLMKFRLVNPHVVIDIGKHLRGEMSYIREGSEGLSIGALTTHYEISSSELLRGRCPMLAKAAQDIGDLQVRNRGTIGGSLCHADPAAHYPPAMVALDALLAARSRGGTRTVRAADFFKDMFTTALAPDEMLVEVRLPRPPGTRWGYEVVHGQGGSFATAIAAVQLRMDGPVCESSTIVIGACSSSPVRLIEAEEVLKGKTLTEEVIARAASAVRSHLKEPLVDARVRASYRREMAALVARRALLAAAGGA